MNHLDQQPESHGPGSPMAVIPSVNRTSHGCADSSVCLGDKHRPWLGLCQGGKDPKPACVLTLYNDTSVEGPESLRHFAVAIGEGVACPWLLQGRDTRWQLPVPMANLWLEAGRCLPQVTALQSPASEAPDTLCSCPCVPEKRWWALGGSPGRQVSLGPSRNFLGPV